MKKNKQITLLILAEKIKIGVKNENANIAQS